MEEGNKHLLYLLRSMISVSPNLFSRSVDIFWGDVFGGLALNDSQALADLVEERHIGLLFTLRVGSRRCELINFTNEITLQKGSERERKIKLWVGLCELAGDHLMFWVAPPNETPRCM